MKVFEGTKNEYYMDGYLHDNLCTAKSVITKDWDMIFLYDGSEGSGKSVKAMQDAYFCDETLNIDRITFTPFQFKKGVLSAKKYQAVVYDEAYTGLSSRATMSSINRTLISMLAEIRQKNLFIFIVMPTFFDLDKYVALWRSRALIHVYTKRPFIRGFFTFFNAEKKKSLYILGKKFYDYNCVNADFYGRFTNHYVIDEVEYRKKKRLSLMDREKKAEEKSIKEDLDNRLFERLQSLDVKITHELKIKILSMPSSTYYRKLKKFEEMKEWE